MCWILNFEQSNFCEGDSDKLNETQINARSILKERTENVEGDKIPEAQTKFSNKQKL